MEEGYTYPFYVHLPWEGDRFFEAVESDVHDEAFVHDTLFPFGGVPVVQLYVHQLESCCVQGFSDGCDW